MYELSLGVFFSARSWALMACTHVHQPREESISQFWLWGGQENWEGKKEEEGDGKKRNKSYA